ncbi:DUF805 domain-containing protein [Deinococcus sp.]|uniref:DUF805 domain-containing protein n=1 Tax=Deinococcus sp. TaxID=47478 RepID=UPI003B5BAAE5
MREFINVVMNCADFKSRLRRKEFWRFLLVHWSVFGLLIFLDFGFGTTNSEFGFGWISGIYALVMTLPKMSALVRRLHDTGHTGWSALATLIPIGELYFLVYYAQIGSQPKANKWGPNPKTYATSPAAGY